MTFTPLQNYAGYNHVLGAAACFVHPGNGNIYFTACEQRAGTQQDLSVYRMVAATGAIELVRRYRGTIDSPSQITMGGAVIGMGGALFVATSLVIPNVPKVTGTGWQGSFIREPDIDAPWSLQGGSDARVASLERIVEAQAQRIAGLELALGDATGGYPEIDRELVRRLREFMRPLLGA